MPQGNCWTLAGETSLAKALDFHVGEQKESGDSLASEKNMPQKQKAEYGATTNGSNNS
jgi:hypothetical protein